MAARVLAADPPWKFGDRLPGKKRGAAKHYACMPTNEIMRFPLPPLAPDAYLFLWRVAAMQEEALQVSRAWGFRPVAEWPWVKTRICRKCRGAGFLYTAQRPIREWCERCEGRGWRIHMGMGHHSRGSTESCLVAVRGRPHPLVKNERNILFAPIGAHSEKPREFYEKVERFAAGPYVELFARRRRNNWLCLGDELPKERAA